MVRCTGRRKCLRFVPRRSENVTSAETMRTGQTSLEAWERGPGRSLPVNATLCVHRDPSGGKDVKSHLSHLIPLNLT